MTILMAGKPTNPGDPRLATLLHYTTHMQRDPWGADYGVSLASNEEELSGG